jgi:hypothetical protein
VFRGWLDYLRKGMKTIDYRSSRLLQCCIKQKPSCSELWNEIWSLISGILSAVWVTAFQSDASFANSIRLKSHDELIILNIYCFPFHKEGEGGERESACVFLKNLITSNLWEKNRTFLPCIPRKSRLMCLLFAIKGEHFIGGTYS